MGRHGPDRPFAIEIAGHGCIPGDRGVDRALRFVLKECSRDHAEALPNVTVRVRALSWFEIAVSVTSSTVTMLPSPSIPASAPEAPAGFHGHLVAIGRGCRRGPCVAGAAGADGLVHYLQAIRAAALYGPWAYIFPGLNCQSAPILDSELEDSNRQRTLHQMA